MYGGTVPKEKLPLKKSKKTICFAFYEKVDRWAYGSLYEKLGLQKGVTITTLAGFSYDSYIKNRRINKKTYPSSLATDKISFDAPGNIFDRIFLFLIKEKFYSLETKILLKQLKGEVDRLTRFIRYGKPDLLIIPEDTDAMRGRLAATIARNKKIATMVFLPLYYDWIGTYPLLGKRIADRWVVPGLNYKKRLLQYNINGKNISMRHLDITTKNRTGENKKDKYYVAALQDNDEQDIFIQMLIDTFKLIPDKKLVFKYHPTTGKKTKRILRKKYSSKTIHFLDKTDLNKLIYYSQGLLTISSTSALIAVKLKKPVIIINVGLFPLELSNLLKGPGRFKVASSPPELLSVISRLDTDKGKKEYLNHQRFIANCYI